MTSTKPYIVRAIFEWCVDQGLTPYITVAVDGRTRVPLEYVKNGQIVLNIGPDAANQLLMGNEEITFQARFNGIAFSVIVPVDTVAAIYAKEDGRGMAFDVTRSEELSPGGESPPEIEPPEPPPAGRPHLTRVK
jgi:stringent starvation protein B